MTHLRTLYIALQRKEISEQDYVFRYFHYYWQRNVWFRENIPVQEW